MKYHELLALNFGKLHLNLRSLEFIVRTILEEKCSQYIINYGPMGTIKEGCKLPKTYFTSDINLRECLDKFNKE